MFDFRSGRKFLFHFQDGIIQLQAGTENEAVCLFQVALHFRRNVVAGKAYAVQAYHPGGVAVYDDEGAYVLHDLGHAAYHGAGADFNELVDTAHAADDCMVFYGDVACHAGEAGHDDVVAEVAVVGYMGVGLQHVVGAYPGFAVFAGGTVDGDVFADQVVVADDYGAVFVMEFEVLGIFTDDGMGVNVVFFTHAHVFGDDGVGADDGAFADFTVLTDHRIGPDDNIFMKDGRRIDDGGWMNFRFCRLNDF